MADGDYSEFAIAHGRRYTLEHLWLQVLDEKKSNSEYGEIHRVVLTRPEDDEEFKTEQTEGVQDDDEPAHMASGDEVGVDDLLITLMTPLERLLINAPFACKIIDLNGDIEDNADLVNDEAYGDGWCVIVQPFDFDEDQYLTQEEYIDYLNELE
jgi:hypothetical protein